MGKDWQRGQTFMNKDPKTEKELGVCKDGYQTGGVNITKEVPNIEESQTVTVRGTKRMLASKKSTVKWY